MRFQLGFNKMKVYPVCSAELPLVNPQSLDRKYKLVIYDIIESPGGTKWSSVTILTKINGSINSTSIRDCLLAKYKQSQSCRRPIPLKLSCIMNVTAMLSNYSSTDNSTITIKPDMTPLD